EQLTGTINTDNVIKAIGTCIRYGVENRGDQVDFLFDQDFIGHTSDHLGKNVQATSASVFAIARHEGLESHGMEVNLFHPIIKISGKATGHGHTNHSVVVLFSNIRERVQGEGLRFIFRDRKLFVQVAN